jgi:hypothetical protein
MNSFGNINNDPKRINVKQQDVQLKRDLLGHHVLTKEQEIKITQMINKNISKIEYENNCRKWEEALLFGGLVVLAISLW